MTAQTFEKFRELFTDFYASLVEVHPEVFGLNGARRIGSTFRVPGAGGLDAQTFYMRHVLAIVFQDEQLVRDLISLARCAFRGTKAPQEIIDRVDSKEGLHHTLYCATEAASSLTGHIGEWKEGTDLFANILTNTDCALQIAGIYDHTEERNRQTETVADTTDTADTLDQSAIDALFD